jgi:hypothetical protein
MADSTALQKQYRRLWLADEDLEEVCDVVELMIEKGLLDRTGSARDLELRVFSTAIVVAYARAFVESNSSSNEKATPALPKGVLKCLTDEQRALHKELIHRRNEEFAHTDIAPTELSLEIGTDGEIAEYSGTRVPLNKSEVSILQPMLLSLRSEITGRLGQLRSKLKPGSVF